MSMNHIIIVYFWVKLMKYKEMYKNEEQEVSVI